MTDRTDKCGLQVADTLAAFIDTQALPGTGVPLSALCVHRFVALWFVAVAYPLVALAAAVCLSTSSG